MKFFNDLFFCLNKPKVIIITGKNKGITKTAVFEVLKSHFKLGKEILIFEAGAEDKEKIKFLVNNSSFPILLTDEVAIAKILPEKGCVIFNSDEENNHLLKNEILASIFSFGSGEGADLFVSDIVANGETNFKINYLGSSVPVWLSGKLDKEKIYAVLAAIACGIKLKLNLVQISQALKSLKDIDKS
ncbi:MAG: hypothetical protein WCX48_11925 [Bacteroidales bacterium]|jgi:hypothetical protein